MEILRIALLCMLISSQSLTAEEMPRIDELAEKMLESSSLNYCDAVVIPFCEYAIYEDITMHAYSRDATKILAGINITYDVGLEDRENRFLLSFVSACNRSFSIFLPNVPVSEIQDLTAFLLVKTYGSDAPQANTDYNENSVFLGDVRMNVFTFRGTGFVCSVSFK